MSEAQTVSRISHSVAGLSSKRAGLHLRSIHVKSVGVKCQWHAFSPGTPVSFPVRMIPPVFHTHISLIYHQFYTIVVTNGFSRQSRWSYRLTHRSEAAWLLGSRVRIPLKVWIFVSCVCCVGSGLCHELITRSEETVRVYASNCM
jgi:hypothetical protein